MFGVRFGRGKFKRVAMVDIGSASAAVGIMEIDPNGRSKLIAAHRSFIPYEKRTKEQFAARMGGAVDEAASKAAQALSVRKEKGGEALSEVYVFFRAPWIDAQVVKLTKNFDEETRITEEHIDTLAKQAVSSEKKLLEAMVLRVEVNGYATPDAIGKTGHLISLFALVTTVDEDLQKGALEYVGKAYPHLKPIWRSHTRALLTYVREHPKHPRNSVLIDISSEGTSILVIRDGILESQLSFDIGVHAILEKLSQSALPEETLGLLRMLEREQCSGEACEQLKKSIERTEQEMVRTFGEKLAELAGKTRLPQEVLLFVHPDMVPWLARFFSKLDFAQFTVPLQPFSVSELATRDVQDWIQIESTTPDISLLLAASLVHIEIHEPE